MFATDHKDRTMSSRRLSFTEKRRARLRLQVDRLDRLETRNTITEPISVLGLSLSTYSGAARLGLMDINALSGFTPPLQAANQAQRPASHAATAPTNFIPIVIGPPTHHRATAGGGGASSQDGAAQVSQAKVQAASDWLTLTPALDSAPSQSGITTPWHPVSGAGGGAAVPPRGGSGDGMQAATAALVRGQTSPLRVPPPPSASAPIPFLPGANGAGANNPAPGLSPRSSSSRNTSQSSRAAGATSPAQNPPILLTPSQSSVASPSGTVQSGPSNSPGTAGSSSPASGNNPLYDTAAPEVYVLDYDRGVQLFPNYTSSGTNGMQLAYLGGPVSLMAQVHLGNDYVSSYSWNVTNLTHATSIAGTGSYNLTFNWDTSNSTAAVDSVTLTVHTQDNFVVNQTYSFYIPTGNVPTYSALGVPQVNVPSQIVPDGQTVQTQNAQIALDTGALETSVTLPTYNPNIAPIVLNYNSIAANYRPIFIAHYQYTGGDTLEAQLNLDGTVFPVYYYTVGNVPGLGGQASVYSYIEVALMADATTMPGALATGRYPYTIGIAMDGTPAAWNSGFLTVVNELNNPVGAGWTLSGLESVGTYAGVGGLGAGVYIDLGGGDSLWYSGTPGPSTTFVNTNSGDYSTMVENADGSFTQSYPNGTKFNFNSGGQEISQVDANGLTTTYTYSGGALQTITDPYGKVTTFSYSGSLLQSITDPAGRITTLTHSSKDLTNVTLPDGSSWGYGYNAADQITSVTDPRSKTLTVVYDSIAPDRVASTVRSDGTTESISYFQQRGLIPYGGFTGGGGTAYNNPAPFTLFAEARTTYTDPLGRQYLYYPDWQGNGRLNQSLDSYGNLNTDERDPSGLDYITVDNLNRITARGYDSNGNLTTVVYPDASTELYTYNSFDEVTSDTDPNGHITSYTYDSHGNLTGIQDPLHNLTTLTYTATGQVQSITDARNNTTTYQYDSQDRLTTLVNPDTTTEKYAYDSAGRLTTATDERNLVTTFAFDPMNRLLGSTDAQTNHTTLAYDGDGDLTGATDPLGRITTYVYDSLDRLTTLTDPSGHNTVYGYNAVGDLTTVTDPLGRITTYAYDFNDEVTTITDALGHTTLFGYDADGELITVTDANNHVTTLGYNVRGWLVTVTDALGKTTSYGYDAAGNQTTVTDPLGRVTTLAYDAANELTTITAPAPSGGGPSTSPVTVYGYDAVGNKTTVTDPLGNVTTSAYDALNRLTTVTDPLNHSTLYGYDGDSNLTTVTDPLGHVTTYAYDSVNRLTTLTNALGGNTLYGYNAVSDVTTVTDPLGRVTSYAYDSLDRATTVTDPLGHNTVLGYDADGNLTSVKDSNGNTTTYVYDLLNRLGAITDPLNHNYTYYYDNVGNITTEFDANGVAVYYGYDADNRLQTVTDGLADATTYVYDAAGQQTAIVDPLGHITTYAYDGDGRVTTITDPLNQATTMAYDAAGNTIGVTDPSGNHTSYVYNDAGLMTQWTDPNGHSATYVYDANNNLTDTTDRDGHRVTYAYDALGRETGEHWLDGSNSGAGHYLTYTYDADSELTGATDPNATLTFTYDPGGRVTTAVTAGPTGTQPLATLTYGYDNVGNRTSMTDSLSNTGRTTYVYDAANRLTTLSQSFGGTAGPQVVFGYDPGGRVTTMTRSIGGTSYFTTTIGYDTVNRVTGIYNFTGSGKFSHPVGSDIYTYDRASRVNTAAGVGFSVSYTYDADNELTNVSGTQNGSSINVTYAYDSAGNRNSTGYTTGTGNEQSAAPGYTYSYDSDGNLISQTNTSTSVTTTYTYDFRDRLTNVTVGGTLVATYTYDALNRRIGIDDNGSQTWTVYDGTNAYADFNGSGTLKERYLYGPAVDELLARTSSGGATAWYISDKNGSVQEIYDATNGLVDTMIYDSFGQVVTETGASYGDRFKYAGMEYDAAIQIYYDQARNYNPVTGRFLQQDPLGLAAGDVNLYRYVFNDPTNLVDPGGLRPSIAGPVTIGQSPPSSSGPQNTSPDDCCCCCCPDLSEPLPTSTTEPPDGLSSPAEEILEASSKAVSRGIYTVGIGLGHFAWDLVAVPLDFGRALLGYGGPGDELSYYGSASSQAQLHGVPAEEIQNEAAKNAATFGLAGLVESGVNYYETGDPTQFQEYSGSFLGGSALGLAAENLATPLVPRSPEAAPATAENAAERAQPQAEAASAPGTALRPVGQFLNCVDDVLKNPQLLRGRTPAEVEALIGKTPCWAVETLGKGTHKGQGWILREYGPNGKPTGRLIQWHPGGGHHGPAPYWKVSSGSGGTVRVGPQFPSEP